MGEELQLLMDWVDGSAPSIILEESSSKSGRTRFRGKFQEADAPNKNKRVYPFHILDENIKKLEDAIRENKLTGELDHPTDSIVHLKNASHKITKLWWEGNALMGEGEILSTPSGKVLEALIRDEVRIGMSSRGIGSGKVNEDGILVIGESYKLITFDVVADPSTNEAYQSKINSRKKESYMPDKFDNTLVKNESSGIHKLNSYAVIACVGGIIKAKTNEYKMGLK